MQVTGQADSESFQSAANGYAVCLETPEGRLRSGLAFANQQVFLPLQAKPSLRALALGCGMGVTAVRPARLGIHVTLLDSSRALLDIAKRTAQEAGVADSTEASCGYLSPTVCKKMLKAASLAMIAERGIRGIAVYLPPRVSRIKEYERIFELERKLSSRPECIAVSRYIHNLARCSGPAREGSA